VPGVLAQADDALGWRQRPNLRGWATLCRGRAVPPTLIDTDERRLREPWPSDREAARHGTHLPRGGNVPQALGVPWSLSLAGMLEGRADARRGVRLEVVNGAMAASAWTRTCDCCGPKARASYPISCSPWSTRSWRRRRCRRDSSRWRVCAPPAKPYYDVFDGSLVPFETAEPEPSAPLAPPAHDPLAWSQLYRLLRRLPPDVGPPQRWLQVQPLPTDHVAEAARAEGVLRAVLIAMRDEATRLGARFALVVVPPPRAPRFGEVTPGHKLSPSRTRSDSDAEPHVHVPELAGLARQSGYIPETTRFNADGHFVASNEIWTFLERQGSSRPASCPCARRRWARGAARSVPRRPPRGAPHGAHRLGRAHGGRRLRRRRPLVDGAPLSGHARDWAMLGVSLAPIGLLTGWTGVAGAVGFAFLFWLAGATPWTLVNRLLLALVVAAAVAVPLLWLARLPTDVSVPIRVYVGAAVAMGLVRGLAYAASRRRLRLVDHLGAMLFFPTFASGPIVSARRSHGRALEASPRRRGTTSCVTSGAPVSARRASCGAPRGCSSRHSS
jgi:hypothetical protein